MKSERKPPVPSAWSLELLLVIGLPLATVIAGIVTIVIAVRSGYTAEPDVSLDRFAQEQPAETRE